MANFVDAFLVFLGRLNFDHGFCKSLCAGIHFLASRALVVVCACGSLVAKGCELCMGRFRLVVSRLFGANIRFQLFLEPVHNQGLKPNAKIYKYRVYSVDCTG